jgi:hypothetical protein
MQSPLFWVDLSAYGVELQAIEAGGKLSSLMVDMGYEPDDQLAENLRSIGFVSHDTANPHRVSHAKPTDETISRIELMLSESQNTAFDVDRHLLIANVLDPTAPPRPPVRNEVQKQRDAAQATPTPPPPTPEPAKDKDDLIVDVGLVRGFAIKELRGNGDKLRAAAARMSRDQQEKYLRKNTLWPSPDYATMAGEGVEPAAAALVKQVRDSFLSAPGVVSSRRKYREPPNPEVYAHAIVTARDIMSPVKTLDEAARAVYRLTEMFSVTRMEESTLSVHRPRCWTRHLSPLTEDSNGEPMSEDDRKLRGVVDTRNDFWLVALDPDDPSRADSLIARNASLGTRGTFDNTRWTFLPRNHKLRTGASGKMSDEEKAARATREHAKPPTRIPRSTHANAVRSGLEQWRTDDVSAEDLIERFDLSGVEFGNWESQRDRQELVNQAYDAFNDLSQALGVSTHAIGLGGRLGMAFGSRGQGGKNPAAAHFEPENFAINLTKRGGAGSLAHEWGHAFDRAGSQGGRIGRHARMASDDLVGHRDWSPAQASRTTFGDTTAKNFDTLMSAILYDPDESIKSARKVLERNQWDRVAMHTQPRIPPYRLEHKDQPVQATIEELVNDMVGQAKSNLMRDCMVEDAMAQSLVSRVVNDTPFGSDHVLSEIQTEMGDDGDDVVSELGRLHTALTETVRGGLNAACARNEHGAFSWAHLRDETKTEAKQMQEEVIHLRSMNQRTRSIMLQQAKDMDGPRAKPYWSRTEEMFARAFECYVKTRIAEQGGRNDFLVSYFKPENMNGDVYESVYPTATHLGRVKAAADALFSELSVDQRESASPMREGQMGVVLYSVDGDRIVSGAPPRVLAELALGEVRRLVGDVAGVSVEDDLGMTLEGSHVAGLYDQDSRLIRIAMNSNDPVASATHEAYHAAADCLMTGSERQVVASAFSPGGRYHGALTDALASQNNNAAIQAVRNQPDEAQAYGFQCWLAGDLAINADNPVSRVFARVQDVIERVRNVFEGYGYQCASDVLQALDDGTIAGRGMDALRRPANDDAEEDLAPITRHEQQPAQAMGLS